MKDNEVKRSGAGCLDVVLICLQVIFITLKCLGLISWSWGVVLIPLYAYIAIIAILLIVLGIVTFYE